LARRKRRKSHRTNFFLLKGKWRWGHILLVIMALFLVGYGVNELHQIRQRQLIEQRKPDAKQQFINSVAPGAQSMMRQHNVLSSITIAQAILESDWGSSTLASKYNNLFGVKSTDTTASKVLNTKEYENGQWIVIHGRFAVYPSWDDSIQAHTLLMVNGTTSNPNLYASVIQATNYKDAAIALQRAGYATDPNYATKLINLIDEYHLNKYDQ
jgi:flagellum-specific peptidoglycan hydrolase FlgJ